MHHLEALEDAYEEVFVLLQKEGGAFYLFELFVLYIHVHKTLPFQKKIHVRDV
jgi:hypothetical protein